MNDTRPLARQWRLLQLLSGRPQGAPIKDLAAEMHVSLKTIRRDLGLFQQLGFPLEGQVGEFGTKTWKVATAWNVTQPSFSFDEALALYLGYKFLQPLAGTVIGEAARHALQKIRAGLGERVLRYVDKMAGVFHDTAFGSSDYTQHAEILEQLLIGIEDRRVVFITYRSQRATEPVTYDIHPYRVTRHQGALYLIGYKPQDQELRTWRLDRIERAEVDRMPFTLPPALDLESRFAGSLGIYDGHDDVRVRIRFSPAAARFVQEKRWHASQQLTPQADGSLIVEFRLSSTVEVKSWVLSFGRDAEVLQPESLRAEVAEELETMRARYRSSSGVPAVSVDGTIQQTAKPTRASRTLRRGRRSSPTLAETADALGAGLLTSPKPPMRSAQVSRPSPKPPTAGPPNIQEHKP
jgi:predicted DNA-binding transcriptional regulator YafY